jgi:cyanate permease
MDRSPAAHGPPITNGYSLRESIVGFTGSSTLMWVALSSGLSAFVAYGFFNWQPAFLMREKGMSLPEIGAVYGIAAAASLALGMGGGGRLADRFGSRDPSVYAWIHCAALAVSLPCFVGSLYAPSWKPSLLLTVSNILNTIYFVNGLAAVQQVVSPDRRSTCCALWLLAVNLLDLGAGPVFVGALSDHLREDFGAHALRLALLGLSPVYLLATAAHAMATRSLSNRAQRPQRIRRAVSE